MRHLTRFGSFLLAASLGLFLIAACSDAGPVESDRSAALVSPDAPAAQSNPDPIAVEMLTDRHTFTDRVAIQIRDRPHHRRTTVANLGDGSNLVVLKITVQAGARFPWHTHPGPVLVAVTGGELVYVYADDCVKRTYAAGTAFVDPGFDNVHVAFNSGADAAVLIATFVGAPPSGPLTIPVDAAVAAELDAKCGIAAAAGHAH